MKADRRKKKKIYRYLTPALIVLATMIFPAAATLPVGGTTVYAADSKKATQENTTRTGSTQRNGELAEIPETVYGGASTDAYTVADLLTLPYEDGEYSIEVSMSGGTGRVTLSSPTLMIIKDGHPYAKILWSSPYYDWMIAGGRKYYNVNTDGGNSYFIIPITELDSLVPVIADTTAMGDPVAIEYSLTFYADSIGDKGLIPQEAAKKVIITAAIVIVVGGILDLIMKKRRL